MESVSFVLKIIPMNCFTSYSQTSMCFKVLTKFVKKLQSNCYNQKLLFQCQSIAWWKIPREWLSSKIEANVFHDFRAKRLAQLQKSANKNAYPAVTMVIAHSADLLWLQLLTVIKVVSAVVQDLFGVFKSWHLCWLCVKF